MNSVNRFLTKCFFYLSKSLINLSTPPLNLSTPPFRRGFDELLDERGYKTIIVNNFLTKYILF